MQINQIENGWLVMLPPQQSAIMRAERTQSAPPQPTVMFGANFDEVVKILKDNWPISLTK